MERAEPSEWEQTSCGESGRPFAQPIASLLVEESAAQIRFSVLGLRHVLCVAVSPNITSLPPCLSV